jgi:ATPase subunit of ABC transporter with duplicated ATPase domains
VYQQAAKRPAFCGEGEACVAFLLGCEKVSVEFSTREVLRDVSLGVDTGQRIGIVGRNGDGKTTLLRVLAGALEPDAGRVVRTRGVSVGVLGQSDALDDADTVQRAIVGDVPDYVWAGDGRVRDVLEGLVADVPMDALVGTLSGGQRRRVDLARLLVADWDVLMLDEPTNHLDMGAISWLAGHLRNRWRDGAGALLVVTHDRWFLDEVANTMWEVHSRKVEPFEGGFSAYILQRVERERLADLAEQKRQNALRRELAWLSRGARARSTKPKFHVATARALIADVPELRDTLELKRMAISRLGKQVVDLHRVSVEFSEGAASESAADEGNNEQGCDTVADTGITVDADATFRKKLVLDDITWMIGPGDRFGILGGNGAGKTTLLKVLTGRLQPTRGRVKIGSTVRFAVLSQHLDALAGHAGERVREVIGRYSRRTMLDGREVTPAQLLERLGFSNADLNEVVDDLSGGQRRRLAIMMILLDEPNVMVLDEPGNDLDIDMLAALEDLLDGWPGTLIVVTHDRYLMERVTDSQFALVGGRLVHCPGGVEQYVRDYAGGDVASRSGLDMRETAEPRGALADAGQKAESPHASAGSSEAVGDVVAGQPAVKLSGGEARELRKKMASSEKKIDTLRGKIEAAHVRETEVDPTDFEALMDVQAEVASFEAQIEELEFEWLEAADTLEAAGL